MVWLYVAFLFIVPISVSAQSSSPNYQVEETQFGTGAEIDLNSPSYQAQSSSGSLGVGSSSSTNYDAEAGFLTAQEPFLEMIVNATTLDLGNLTTTAVSAGSMSFSVRTYLSSAYSVLTLSNPPTNESGYQLDPMSIAAGSSPGTEQFGINVVDNSSPDVGANPVNAPDNTFADGGPSSGYNTANQFKYVVGDSIARSAVTATNQAVGHTTYTISYIANISSITEAGVYTMGHDLVVVATY